MRASGDPGKWHPGRMAGGAAATAVVLGLLAGHAIPALAVPGAGRTAGPAGAAGTISTIAGGVGGPGPARTISIAPCGLDRERLSCGIGFSGGKLYFTSYAGGNLDGAVVRAVSIRTGRLTTPAGDGRGDVSGDGGRATQAGIGGPRDVSADQAGNLLIADRSSVRVVAARTGMFYGQAMTAGHIYTVAGGGASTANGVPATTAAVQPAGAIVDHDGNIVVWTASLVRVVAVSTGTFYGQAMTAGDIYTVAGGGASRANGAAATSADIGPYGAAVDPAGNLLIADRTTGWLVRVVAVSTGMFYGQAMTAGDIYTVAGGTSGKLREGVPATRSAVFPYGLAVDSHGNVLVADLFDNLVRVIAVRDGRFYGQQMKAGDIYAVAGGGPASVAPLRHPQAVTVDSAGNIAIASQDLMLHVLAARTGTYYGVRMTAGHLYAVAGNGQEWAQGARGPATAAQFHANGPITYDQGNLVIAGYRPAHNALNTKVWLVPRRSGTYFGRAMQAGRLYLIIGSGLQVPDGLAADAHGNLLVTDTSSHVFVLAGRTGRFYGIAMRAGRLYRIAGNGSDEYSGDGGKATEAGMSPGAVAVDANGNVVIGDAVRVRVIAERTGTFYGLAMTAGDIYTIAGGGAGGNGGPAIDAQFTEVNGLAVDGSAGILVSDLYQVRMIATATGTFFGVPMTAGDIYAVAGTGSPGTSGDGGPALAADIEPEQLTIDGAGDLVLYDQAANKVRAVPSVSGTYYGAAMTADDLYSIVGGGNGALGDGGPGTSASIDFSADGLAAGGGSGVALTDEDGIRVRLVLR